MNFLRKEDYLSQIQTDNLSQIIEKNDRYRTDAEGKAIAEMDSYLAQRYDSSKVFSGMTDFDEEAEYLYGQRFLYSSDTLQPEKDIYYITNPDTYDEEITYTTGNRVLYDGSVYECTNENTGKLPTNGDYFELVDTLEKATIPAGSFTENEALFTLGDNRNQALVMYLIDMTLYHLHSRINPRSTPEIRAIRYDGNNPTQNGGAIAWLKKVAKGEATVNNIPKITPTQGSRVSYGSNTKQTHAY